MAGFTIQVVVAAYLYEKTARKEKRKRRFSVYTLNVQRDLEGAFILPQPRPPFYCTL
jgi:hypothetical protein